MNHYKIRLFRRIIMYSLMFSGHEGWVATLLLLTTPLGCPKQVSQNKQNISNVFSGRFQKPFISHATGGGGSSCLGLPPHLTCHRPITGPCDGATLGIVPTRPPIKSLCKSWMTCTMHNVSQARTELEIVAKTERTCLQASSVTCEK